MRTIFLCSILLTLPWLTACESSLRVAQATFDALQSELTDDGQEWARAPAPASQMGQHTGQQQEPPVAPSITRPAGALNFQGWAKPEPDMTAAPQPSAPKQLLAQKQTGSVKTAMGQHQWAYAGPYGPGHWAEMSAANHACGAGRAQSPIELASAQRGDLPELAFHYKSAPLIIENDGHTLKFPQPAGSWLAIGTARYELLQVHVHVPGEHALGGQYAAMEIHFVHQNIHGQLAVVAVMAQPGPANKLMHQIAKHAPTRDATKKLEDQFDPMALLPRDRRYLSYHGSLTTPPCTEGVAWHVLMQPIGIASADIEAMANELPQPNTRPLQALNGRRILTN